MDRNVFWSLLNVKRSFARSKRTLAAICFYCMISWRFPRIVAPTKTWKKARLTNNKWGGVNRKAWPLSRSPLHQVAILVTSQSYWNQHFGTRNLPKWSNTCPMWWLKLGECITCSYFTMNSDQHWSKKPLYKYIFLLRYTQAPAFIRRRTKNGQPCAAAKWRGYTTSACSTSKELRNVRPRCTFLKLYACRKHSKCRCSILISGDTGWWVRDFSHNEQLSIICI